MEDGPGADSDPLLLAIGSGVLNLIPWRFLKESSQPVENLNPSEDVEQALASSSALAFSIGPVRTTLQDCWCATH